MVIFLPPGAGSKQGKNPVSLSRIVQNKDIATSCSGNTYSAHPSLRYCCWFWCHHDKKAAGTDTATRKIMLESTSTQSFEYPVFHIAPSSTLEPCLFGVWLHVCHLVTVKPAVVVRKQSKCKSDKNGYTGICRSDVQVPASCTFRAIQVCVPW
jgi:hypothetical protein